jgi:parallel beta-helix repeat protein
MPASSKPPEKAAMSNEPTIKPHAVRDDGSGMEPAPTQLSGVRRRSRSGSSSHSRSRPEKIKNPPNWPLRILLTLLGLVIVLVAGTVFGLEQFNTAPRQLAPYLDKRAQGHHPQIAGAAAWASGTLMKLDRGQAALPVVGDHGWRIGAQPVSGPAPTSTDVVMVSNTGELVNAMAQARAGEVITILPGTYRFPVNLELAQSGRDGAPITVRADRPGTVFLEFNMEEGFIVNGPFWTFENLNIRGVCKDHNYCEHAFHVVGKAAHFIARNNTISDFNAHFKINGNETSFPDDGLIEANTITNTAPRQTDRPVTPIDLVGANRWRIAHNLISDFIKAGGDRISYGAFVKGGGAANRLEQNIVLCEDKLLNLPGSRVGLSLGGGGTGAQYCRDRRCLTEQDAGVIESNLIASCTDDGIYLNRAAASKIFHNTLIDTGSVSVRFVESTADVEGNLIDSTVQARDGGELRLDQNLTTGASRLYLGMHPVRDLFADAAARNFSWKKKPPVRDDVNEKIVDLCASSRPAQPVYGAFEDFAACIRH